MPRQFVKTSRHNTMGDSMQGIPFETIRLFCLSCGGILVELWAVSLGLRVNSSQLRTGFLGAMNQPPWTCETCFFGLRANFLVRVRPCFCDCGPCVLQLWAYFLGAVCYCAWGRALLFLEPLAIVPFGLWANFLVTLGTFSWRWKPIS